MSTPSSQGPHALPKGKSSPFTKPGLQCNSQGKQCNSPKPSRKQLKGISSWQTSHQVKDHMSHTGADPTFCAQADLRRNLPHASSSPGATHTVGQHRGCTRGLVADLCPCHEGHTADPAHQAPAMESSAGSTEALASFQQMRTHSVPPPPTVPSPPRNSELTPRCGMLRAAGHIWELGYEEPKSH